MTRNRFSHSCVESCRRKHTETSYYHSSRNNVIVNSITQKRATNGQRFYICLEDKAGLKTIIDIRMGRDISVLLVLVLHGI